MIEVLQYTDKRGRNIFGNWFLGLDAVTATRVEASVIRLEQGNFSTVKGVGSGVFESRLDFGPGYRLYFGKDGEQVVVLLAGGTKKRQQQDIATAQQLWEEYKQRKTVVNGTDKKLPGNRRGAHKG